MSGAPGTSPILHGVRIGVDVGTARIGVARSDPHLILATPVTTVRRRRDGSCLDEIMAIITEHEAVEVIVGLPAHLSGAHGASAADAKRYAERLARACAPVPVRLVDERLTTVSAHQVLHAAGRPGRSHRSVVDQVAAVMILQNAMETMRTTEAPVGELVSVGSQNAEGNSR